MKKCIALLLILSLLTGCGAPAKTSRTVYAMDTVMTLTVYGGHSDTALESAEAELHRLDTLLSISDPDSEIYRLNRDKQAALSQETAGLILRALEISDATGGDFDPTVYPLMVLWGFPAENYRVPPEAELDTLLPAVGYGQVALEDGFCTLPESGGLDLGAIAKGYAAQQVLAVMQAAGADSAVISLGGNVGTLGKKPGGTPWTVAIEHPGKTGEYLATLSLEGGYFAITSGAYERYFEQDGVRYHHILDPKTGKPAETNLLSVTVVSPDGTLADALSTALFVKGLAGAVEFWQARGDFDMVLYDGDTLYVTPGLHLDTGLTVEELLR